MVSNVIIERSVADTTDLEALREAALERCGDGAENRNLYDSWVLENLYQYRAYKPEPSEVVCHLRDDEQGDWRAVAKTAAILSTRSHLEAEVESDLAILERAVGECRERGFVLLSVSPHCLHGWASHGREAAWGCGTLYEWPRLEGGSDATMFRVPLSGKSEVWLDLGREP